MLRFDVASSCGTLQQRASGTLNDGASSLSTSVEGYWARRSRYR
jgi:hypothetical protein